MLHHVSASTSDGSSHRGYVRLIESGIGLSFFVKLTPSSCLVGVMKFVGCAAALPMGVAPEAMCDL